MSYILDALRKSDAQRRLGQPPDLNTASAAAPPARRRRSRWWLPLLIVVLLLALVMVFGRGLMPQLPWLPFAEPQSDADPHQPQPEPIDAGETMLAETPAEEDIEAEPTALEETDPAQAEQAITAVSRPAPSPARDRRPPRQQAPSPAQEREQLVRDPEEVRRMIESAPARTAPPAEPQTRPAAVPARAPQASAGTSVREPVPPAESGEAWAPERSEFLRQWELPLSIRRELPDLRLSIHVFSVQPQDRFVLINGERRVEGDELGGGASLTEIRREGAVVRFRDYSFLLEP